MICIVQTVTHLSGTLRSVELAAIGRRVCEVEWDLLELLAGTDPLGSPDAPVEVDAVAMPEDRSSLHDAPSALELLDAVREFLVSDVMAGTDGRLRFHARVAANVVAMVGRQIALGPHLQSEHAERLRRLGLANDAELADAIRAGALEARREEVFSVVTAAVAAKLAVAHPGYRLPLSPT